MKITKVTPIHAGQFLFVRIETDSGLHGVGEGGSWGQIEAAVAAVAKFATYLEGEDPFPIEHHWNVMHRFSYFQGHAINAAISAIDIALWDIKGKALGVPVYELLGGPIRDRARVYGHVYEKNIDALLAELKRKKDRGFTAVGHINPFLDEGEDQIYFKSHIGKMREAIDNVRRMREVAGDDMDLCIEIHRRLTPAEAVVFARGIEEFHPMFLEDPMRYEDADAMARIADKIHIPIATGERFSTIYEFQALFTRNAVEYARVDVGLCGGITGSRKGAAMAEAHNIMVVPHNPLSPVGLVACLQLDAAIPNFAIQEYSTGFEAGVMKSVDKHLGHDVVDDAPVPVDGFVTIPTRPGIGIDLVDDPAAIRPPLSKPVLMRMHADGSPVDQ
ncbi:MAG: mandelate racemase/muconate lactonizing enzyme family protein [Rhodospirillaceae bacterium]|nr:mandelate racemase/muconate lactonizing enzyme family protein [Rhodospirillaceae bacterium]